MKHIQKQTEDESSFVNILVFILIIFTSVVCGLKRVEEFYYQLSKDDSSSSLKRHPDFLFLTESVPASVHLMLFLYTLCFFHGLHLHNHFLIIFSSVNIAALGCGIFFTHCELYEQVRHY